MKRTEPTDEEHARAGRSDWVDFDALRERGEAFSDCGTARSVREALARVLAEELAVDAVGIYHREGDRYRALVRDSNGDSVVVPEFLPGGDSPIAAVVDEGGTHCGGITGDAFGEATEYCVTPLNGDGAVLLLSADPDGFGSEVHAALSMLSGHAEVALGDVEGGTLRRAATAEVRPDVSEEELLEALSHAFPDSAFILDEDGTFLDVLLGIRTIELRPQEELVGRSVGDVHDEREADRIVSAIRAAIGTGDVQRVEYSTGGTDDRAHFEGRVAPLPNVGGRPAAVLVARDVTRRHERERDLRRQNERLEEFAAIVSHDLRNPLNTATGFLELLSEDVDDERIDRIATAHDRMAALIEDLLALARNGRRVTDAAPVDLRTAAEQAWATVSPDGTLEVTGTTTVRADPARFRQVLENLVRNAADHAAPHPTVTIGPLANGEGFYVADDGPGIPGDERTDVFETGYTSIPGGTGLGLAIVERAAEAHGWTVEAHEGEDGGARFEFRGVDVVGGGRAD
ncbi:PAS domain-containing sensor histidine kinase [Halorarum halophilum]|uniref:histidine kinase n=1 Tax=Halorarum halophilum TaxID=2743090 RepID=A0A7D5GDM3_9EURY|nr:PAS domain-containing sensor histidine kinase [Halobaculum halophilum]QLG26728.1 PAS domain-containing sensor histidine kinase [Halobaculum halophilum]